MRLFRLLPLLLLTACQSAGEAVEYGPAPSPSIWAQLLDNAVGLTILFLLLSAIIGALVKNRRRDRVLKEFDDFRVTVVLQDGRRIWGVARIFPNGMEVTYEEWNADPSGHVETSFFIHASEFAAVRAILRPVEKMTPRMMKLRKRELRRYISPSIQRRVWRFTVIQFSVLRDAFMQAFALLIGQAKNLARPGSSVGSILQTQDKHLTTIGQTVISSVNLTNDPMLESLFGRACVLETKEGTEWRELPGFLKEYSGDWLLLLRSGWPLELKLTLADDQAEVVSPEGQFGLRREGEKLIAWNEATRNIELVALEREGTRIELNGREVRPGETMALESLPSKAGDLVLELRYIEPGDLVLPRSTTVVRHRGARENLSILENLGIR